MMFTGRLLPGSLMLAIALFTGGCAQHPEIVKLYEAPAVAHAAYRHLYVVAVSSDADLRVALEQRLLDQLHRNGVDGTASHTALVNIDGVLQDELDRAAAEAGADGLLIAHVASIDTEFELEQGREDLLSECRGGDAVDYFLYDHRVLREPDSVRLAHTVVVVSNFYDAAQQKRLWTIQSTCFRKSDLREAIADEAKAIVRQLAIDGLI